MNRYALAFVGTLIPVFCAAAEERELLMRIDALQAELIQPYVSPEILAANVCGSAPLPLTPVGPVSTATWRFGTSGDPVTVRAWRIPCTASDSMVVLTLQPSSGTNPSLICGASMKLLQSGGLETDVFSFWTNPPSNSSFCSDVVAPVTVAFVPRTTTPANFDFDQGFTIDFDGASAGHQILAISAYDPSQYALVPPAGPNSVEVRVRGSGTHYRNCLITTTPIGGGTQYAATCASESPLKAGGFERYDY